MPWTTPDLEDVRAQGRDFLTARLNGGSLIPNSPGRVISDANAALAYLTLLYLDYLSQQFLPDAAEDVWLKRHAQIWLGGYKQASFASGSVTITGTEGTAVPAGQQLSISSLSGVVQFELTTGVTIGATQTSVAAQALTAGEAGNLDPGTILGFSAALSGLDATATVVTMSGGADAETDDELRVRVLDRIRQPPMGGDADDYVAWALAIPGVTRAWCSPCEQGVGTVTLRFMMDDVRASDDPIANGFPLSTDVAAVQALVDMQRPVTVADFFVCAPIPEPIDYTVTNLDNDTPSVRAAIVTSVTAMLADRAKPAFALNGVGQPAQTIYVAWVSEAVLDTAGVGYFDLQMADHPMPNNGYMAVHGTLS